MGEVLADAAPADQPPNSKRRRLNHQDHDMLSSSATGTCTPVHSTSGQSRNRSMFQCPHCHKLLTRTSGVNKHLKTHEAPRNISCSELGCQKTFRSKEKLQDHIDYVHLRKQRDFACDVDGCGSAFNNRVKLRRHEENVHGSGLRCLVANCTYKKKFRRQDTLERHMLTHQGIDPLVCEKCGASFAHYSKLAAHRRQKHPPDNNNAHCPTPHSPPALHPPAPLTDVWCALCTISFASVQLLTEHARSVHFVCADCPYVVYGTAEELARHTSELHEKSHTAPQHACSVCGKLFSRAWNRNKHYQTVHQKEGKFTCSSAVGTSSQLPDIAAWKATFNGCGKVFSSRQKLIEHIRHVHLQQPRSRSLAANGQNDIIKMLGGTESPTETVTPL